MALLPRRLNARITLAVACILLSTGIALGWMTASDQSDGLLADMRANSSVMVQNFAESAARYLLVEDYAELEGFLMKSAELPDVERIQLCEPDGRLIWDIERGADGHPVATTRIAHIEPPAAAVAAVTLEHGRLVIWQPVAAGSLLGWLKAEYSLATIEAARTRTWERTFLLVVIWVACSVLLIVLVLRPIVRAIGGLTAFAKQLDERKGEHIEVDESGLEIAELGASLNEASTKLQMTEAQLVNQRESLRRANRALTAISRCNETLVRADDEQRLLGDICRLICDEAGYRSVGVAYAAADREDEIVPAAWADGEASPGDTREPTAESAEFGCRPLSTAIREGISACIDDLAAEPAATPGEQAALQRGYRSIIALPLKDGQGTVFGVLAIYSAEAHAFQAGEIRLLEELAGNLAYGIGALRNRVERLRAEAEIRALNEDLEKRVAERTTQFETANKELEAFAYSVSHDLRAPLRHIDGFVHLLAESTEGKLDEEDRHFMETIRKSVRNMEILIDDLLSFSRMGRGEMNKSPVNLHGLVQEVIRELEPESHGREVLWDIGELPEVAGDRAMIKVVLVNLISNALKFTRRRERAEIGIGSTPGMDGEIVVYVRDNGAGFDMRQADRLFGVFQRLHRADEFEGTGIGLANVRRVITRHGGRTWAEGKIDGGATFYFSLPTASA